jgi:hypothetical protein
MRTFQWNAPIIIGAGALAFLLLAPAPTSLRAEEPVTPAALAADPMTTAAVVIDTESAKQPATFAELRSHLDSSDRDLALNAIQVVLTELSDGATLVWRRPSRELTGLISRRFATTRARYAGTSFIRCRSAPMCGRSRASPAAGRTATGRSGADNLRRLA